MQKIIFYLVLILFSINLYSQNITGIVKDAKTQKPISSATVQISKSQGTISNEEGKFELNISNFKKTDSLKVTYIGYKTASFLVNEVPKIILLEEDIINLKAVNLNQEQLSAEEIIQKTNTNYSVNYNDFKNLKQRVFIRNKNINNVKQFNISIDKAKNYDKKLITDLNNVFNSIKQPMIKNNDIEFRDVLFDVFHKDKDSVKSEIIKATVLNNPNNDFSIKGIQKKLKTGLKTLFKDKIFKIKIMFFKVEDSLKTDNLSKKKKKSVIYPGALANQMKSLYKKIIYNDVSLIKKILNPKYYDYKITDNLFYNNEFVYEITFSPRRSKAKYTGKLYISDESFAVIKLNFKMLPNKKLEGTNLKWLGVSYKLYDWNGTLEFYQNDLGKYVPKYFKQSKKLYSYIKIPFKFIENTKRKNKLKFKMKTKLENIFIQKHEYVFLENKSLKNSDYNKIVMKKEAPLIKLKKYNPQIWGKYNIPAPTQSLLEFEVK
jgi:hypothetical protein